MSMYTLAVTMPVEQSLWIAAYCADSLFYFKWSLLSILLISILLCRYVYAN